jgi:hypothetical protein
MDSSVKTVTTIRAARQRTRSSISGRYKKYVSLFTAFGPTHPSVQRVNRGRGADHSPPSSHEVNACTCTSTPQYVLIAWCLIKHRDIFTFSYNVFMKPVSNADKGPTYQTNKVCGAPSRLV